jgi:hypothetical protein
LLFRLFGELDYSPDLNGVAESEDYEGDLALGVVDQLRVTPLEADHHEYYKQDDDVHHMRDPPQEQLHTFSVALDDPA